MNKKLLIGLVVLLLIGGGVGFVVMNKKGTPAPSGTPQTTTGGGNVFTSIKDALSKSLSLECMFTDEDGRQTKAYMKAGAVRSDFTGKTANESGSVIMKDKKIYFWNAQGGFMMEVPDETPAAGEPKTKETPGGVGDMLETMEQYKESCKFFEFKEDLVNCGGCLQEITTGTVSTAIRDIDSVPGQNC